MALRLGKLFNEIQGSDDTPIVPPMPSPESWSNTMTNIKDELKLLEEIRNIDLKILKLHSERSVFMHKSPAQMKLKYATLWWHEHGAWYSHLISQHKILKDRLKCLLN